MHLTEALCMHPPNNARTERSNRCCFCFGTMSSQELISACKKCNLLELNVAPNSCNFAHQYKSVRNLLKHAPTSNLLCS